MVKRIKVILPLVGIAILGGVVFSFLVSAPDGPRGNVRPQIAAGDGHALFLAADGRLYAWGRNDFGQMGDGTGGGGSFVPTRYHLPVAIKPEWVWSRVAAGDNHSLAIRPNGTRWTWGRNDYGQLGGGGIQGRNRPIQIADIAAVFLFGGWPVVFAFDKLLDL